LFFRRKNQKEKIGAAEEKEKEIEPAPKKRRRFMGSFSLPIAPSASSENLHLFASRTF